MPAQRSVRDRLLEPSTLIVATVVVGVSGVALSQVLTNPYTVVLPPLSLLGAVLAALLVYRTPAAARENVQVALPGVRVPLVALSAAVAGAVLYAFTVSGFQRSLPVHLLQFLLYGLVAAGVVLLASTRLTLALVVGAGLVHRATIYYASALPLGLDTQFHNRAAAGIAQAGSLEPLALSKYWYAPLYHLVTAVTSGLLGLPVRDAAFLTTTVVVTLAPAIGIYVVLASVWSDRHGVLGAFLYLLSDYALSTSVVTGPTSIGLALFVLLLPIAIRYVHEGGWVNGAGVVTLVGLLVVTHQLTLFITTVAAVGYLLGLVVWRGSLDRRDVALAGVFGGAVLLQWTVTRYSGPAGDAPRFLTLVVDQVLRALGSASVRETNVLPAGVDAVLSGAASLAPVHVLGFGSLVCAGVLGAIYWLGTRDGTARACAVGLSSMTVLLLAAVFVWPMAGIEFLVPSRWFRFLYVPLVILGAPGLLAMVGTLADLPGWRLDGPSPVVLAVVLLVLLAPYTVVMAWNYPGAVDDPVFDDAPGAQRLSTTDAEADLYRTVAANAGSAAVMGDHVAWQLVDRNFGQPASIYVHDHGTTAGSVSSYPTLLVDRAYARTSHGSYLLRYGDRRSRVFGPLPFEPEPSTSVVYTNGADQIYLRR